MEEKRTISNYSFKEKYQILKESHTKQKKILKTKKNASLVNAKKNFKNKLSTLENNETEKSLKNKYSRECKVIKRKYKLRLKTLINRYSLAYNALKNEELYRKGALETQVAKLKTEFRRKKYSQIEFDDELEKSNLNKKIKAVKKKYSKPISKLFRKTRTLVVEEMLFVSVPLNTPFRKNLKSILILLLGALISTFALDVFIKPFGTYNAGLRGISQSLFYVLRYYKPETTTSMSYVIYIAMNIPLAIFGYFMVGKKFTFYTILFLLMQYAISTMLFASRATDLIKPFGYNPSEMKRIILDNDETLFTSTQEKHFYRFGIPLISAIIGAIIYGISLGLVYKAGASNGGSKFFVTWISVKKDISIGKIALIVSIFVISFGIILNKVIIQKNNLLSAFTSITFFSTVAFVITSNFVLDMVFAKSRKEKISVITNKKATFMRFLDVKLMYNRTFAVSKIKTSFNKNQKHKIEFLVSATESSLLMKMFKQLDPKALITSIPVNKSQGKFYSHWFE